jgi:pheromone shutdown-related protein TraB
LYTVSRAVRSSLTTQLENVISLHTSTADNQHHYPADVHRVAIDGREFILVGTAHVSQESATLVQDVIVKETPDCVCVELDQQRYMALSQQRRWEDLNLKEVIRKRQLSTLLVGLILSSYQKKLGGYLGVMPGTELLEATKIAQQHGIPIALCDRDVRITLGRAWRSTPLFKKLLLASLLLRSVFDASTISEDALRELRQQDVLTVLLEEMGTALPTLRQVLIDERDLYLAQTIRQARGDRIVAVVGAAHVPGIRRLLLERRQANLEQLNTMPPVAPLWRWLGWGIPALIVASLAVIGWQQGATAAGHNALYWILANGIPSALGGVAALAHPLTILTAFLVAPITSLTPIIGAGYVTALVQAYLQPPAVRELQSVADDVRFLRRWWQNRLLRIFLAFLLPGIGSLIGTWIGGYEILSNLF